MATGGQAARPRSQPLRREAAAPAWGTGEALPRVQPRSGLRCPPGGAPPEPRSDWAPPSPPRGPPRDRDPPQGAGAPPAPPAPPQCLRLLNTLTGQGHRLQVGGPAGRGLLQGALAWNAHAGGYAWRCGGAPLHPQGPPPPPDPQGSPPTVLLYFADDFVEL